MKAPGASMDDLISIPSDSDDGNKEHVSITEEVDEERWCKVVDFPKVVSTNILQIPSAVVEKCLVEPPSTIKLYDEDLDENHPCVLKMRYGSKRFGLNRSDSKETFLARGWYKFAKGRNLCEGDVLHFSISYPSVIEIKVRMVSWCACC
ncbi:hypothetical protein RYX36_019134 [Vicia faba]